MKISSSDKRVPLHRIGTAIELGRHFATAVEVALDRAYIENYRHDWCWVDFRDTPQETGWYKIDRTSQTLSRISDEDAMQLDWHERLFIYESARTAVEDRSPLALYIGDEYSDGRLSGLYLCGPDYLAWVAQR